MITLQLHSYDSEIAEMLLIMRAIEDHPELKIKELAKLLNMGRSSIYRKLRNLEDQAYIDRLINEGYTLSQTVKIIKKTMLKINA
jgi:DNA-binding IclR family transcriptional regulator